MSELYKYPRTPHLPYSLGASSDDKYASDETLDFLRSGIDLVVTEKLDGGNITFYRDAFHARSLTSGTHAWETVSKRLWAQIKHDIPLGWRISGESMYARRSIAYNDLPGVFIVFGIWDEKNHMLPWVSIEEWCDLLDLPPVPVLYSGNDYEQAKAAWGRKCSPDSSEGFVIRNAGEFAYENFSKNVAKYVRANHVQTADSWRNRTDFAVNTFLSARESE